MVEARERVKVGVVLAPSSENANGLFLMGGVAGLRGEDTLTVEPESLDETWEIEPGLWTAPRSGELFGEEELGIWEGILETWCKRGG